MVNLNLITNMAQRTRKYGLDIPNFTPATFQGTVYTPQQEDMSLLANSMRQLEERQRTAAEKASAMDLAFANVRSKLHQDKETMAWFDNYVNKYKNKVDSYARIGDYGNAINAAIRLAGEARNDAGLEARIRANEEYEEIDKIQKARVREGKISQNTYDWWKATKGYKFDELKDDNGNVIGGTLATKDSEPLDDLDIVTLSAQAFKLITPQKGSTTNKWDNKYSNQGEASRLVGKGKNAIELETGEYYDTSGQKTSAYEKVNIKDIKANLAELAKRNGSLEQMKQGLAVAKFSLEKAKQERDRLEEELNVAKVKGEDITELEEKFNDADQFYEQKLKDMSSNGSIIDFDEYYARQITDNLFAKNLAYDWRTVVNDSGTAHVFNRTKTSKGKKDEEETTHQYPVSEWNGVTVTMPIGKTLEQATNVGSGASSIFEKANNNSVQKSDTISGNSYIGVTSTY